VINHNSRLGQVFSMIGIFFGDLGWRYPGWRLKATVLRRSPRHISDFRFGNVEMLQQAAPLSGTP